MSRFITDEDLELFVREVLQEDPRRKQTALQLLDSIRAQHQYEERAKCNCVMNGCHCLLPMDIDPKQIQAGDGFEQTTPGGAKIHLHALGVRRPAIGIMEICTAGWPAAIVRTPDHGAVELTRKGKGITKAELRHRRNSFGGGWEDGL